MYRKQRRLSPVQLMICAFGFDTQVQKKMQFVGFLVRRLVYRSNWCFSFAPELVGYSAPRDLHRRAAYSICESWFLIHQDVYHDLFVCS